MAPAHAEWATHPVLLRVPSPDLRTGNPPSSTHFLLSAHLQRPQAVLKLPYRHVALRQRGAQLSVLLAQRSAAVLQQACMRHSSLQALLQRTQLALALPSTGGMGRVVDKHTGQAFRRDQA